MAVTSSESTDFRGEIRVASRIIDYLSSGLYESPAACLKELINNAYDADASTVSLYVMPDADRIIIEDDGAGFTKDEFVQHFKRISESHKRDKADITEKNRKKIGKIGIGFIAANELCDYMELYSTTSDSNQLLHVTINFQAMRKSPEERRRETSDFAKADYVGEILTEETSAHYTQVFLQDVRGNARDILVGAKAGKQAKIDNSLYGISPQTIEKLLRSWDIKTWHDLDTYSRTMLEIALNVPVPYFDSWLPNKLLRRVSEFHDTVSQLGFKVYYDGTELRKPVVFDPDPRAFIHRFEFEGDNVSAKGYFYAQHGSIHPIELHGLLLRIRNAAVGDYDSTFWDFSQNEFSLIQRWVSAEVWADDRLEEAMNIDRRTLRIVHPAYVELRNAIHTELRKVLAAARSDIYQAGSKQRRKQKAERTAKEIYDVLEEELQAASPKTAHQLASAWTSFAKQDESERALLRKYTVSELYQIVIEVAEDVLSRDDLDNFLRALTDRLQR